MFHNELINQDINDSILSLGKNNAFKPRAIFIDTDTVDINRIKNGSMRSFFD